MTSVQGAGGTQGCDIIQAPMDERLLHFWKPNCSPRLLVFGAPMLPSAFIPRGVCVVSLQRRRKVKHSSSTALLGATASRALQPVQLPEGAGAPYQQASSCRCRSLNASRLAYPVHTDALALQIKRGAEALIQNFSTVFIRL